MKRLCNLILLAVAALIGYRILSDMLEETRDFR